MNNLDINNLIFQLTKSKNDIYINFNEIDLTNFFRDDIRYVYRPDIISENLQEVQYGQKVLDLFLSAKNNSQIKYKDILDKLSDKWLYKDDFKKSIILEDLPIIFYSYKLDNKESIKKTFTEIFGTEFYKYQTEIINSYFNEYQNCIGYFKILRNRKTNLIEGFLMCIDINYLNKETIKHELTHYFQIGLSVLKPLKQIDTSNLKDIPSLNLTKDDLLYLFERSEFDAWILVNLSNGLKFIYELYYKKFNNDKLKTYKDFLEYFIYLIETYQENICTTSFWNILQQLIKLYPRRQTLNIAIKLAAVSCYLNIEWNYLKSKILSDF